LSLASCTFSSAYCQSRQITLLVQQTPNEGGQVTPLAGAHKFDQDSQITLTATPNTGYEFLYWLGDVNEKDSTSTVVHLDKPKIVIAVFQAAQGNLDASSHVSGGGGGGGGLMNNHVNIGNSGSISGGGGGGKPQQQRVYAPAGDKPPVVPEPATGILFALGSLFTFAKRHRKKFILSRK